MFHGWSEVLNEWWFQMYHKMEEGLDARSDDRIIVSLIVKL